eukprot:TRINITY_DN30708_c0_g1_i1.p1 TRINITY_DN30708_c0_g1~~TRINITY_DN30708_c0_g1_i1.p1  ORF type:complete len:240 (+),score=29.46 TRINITY_DN30708_c0_g1_i1:35-754(+)
MLTKSLLLVVQVVVCVGDGALAGDGLVASFTTTSPANFTSRHIGCNPAEGYRYLRISNGGPVTGGSSCGCSWDLYEIRVYNELGSTVQLTLRADSGSSTGKNMPASNAIDQNDGTYWYGDHDVGLQADCWKPSKLGGQWIEVDVGQTTHVSKFEIVQGGYGNEFAVKNVQLHCSLDANSWTDAFLFGVSSATTTVTCTRNGSPACSGYYPVSANEASCATVFCRCIFITVMLTLYMALT